MDEFSLFGGAHADVTAIAEAIKSHGPFPVHFFDTRSGSVTFIIDDDALRSFAEAHGQQFRYLLIDSYTDIERSDIMRDFIEELSFDDLTHEAQERIENIFAAQGWREVVAYLLHTMPQIYAQWEDFFNEEALSDAEDWILQIPETWKQRRAGCGNCVHCQTRSALRRCVSLKRGDVGYVAYQRSVDESLRVLAECMSTVKKSPLKKTKKIS